MEGRKERFIVRSALYVGMWDYLISQEGFNLCFDAAVLVVIRSNLRNVIDVGRHLCFNSLALLQSKPGVRDATKHTGFSSFRARLECLQSKIRSTKSSQVTFDAQQPPLPLND